MIKLIFFLLILFSPFITAQKESVVAEIGNRKIYESEFKERFDFSVHPGLLKGDSLKAKQDFLHQLIAEKLLSIEAGRRGSDTLEAFKDLMIPLENMFVRDALYTSEIKNKISYSQNDIDEGVLRISKLLKLKFIYSKDQHEIEEIFSLLLKGASFDSLLNLRNEAEEQKVPREVTFGAMEKPVENAVYSLKIGEFTRPVESEDGFYILKLIDIENNLNLKDQELIREDVKRIVQTRAEFGRYQEYHRNLFGKERAAADREIFEKLSSEFVKKFKEKYSVQKKEYGDKFFLINGEISSVSKSFQPDLLSRPFIKLEKPFNLKIFLNQLSQEGFYVQDTTELSIRSSLSSYIRKFIEDQVLTEEGERNGFDNSDEVKKYTGMWKDYYLSKMLMMNMFDSVKVGEEEAYSLYKQNKDMNIHLPLINIAEVLTDSLEVIETVMNELAAGKNIKELAKKYTKRDSLKEKGGEFGFFHITKYGELGKIALQMSIGQIYGRVKLDEGYSVFQLLDKKEDTAGYKMDYSDVKDQIILMLTMEKFEKYVNEYNAGLAQKYGVKIYEDVLKNIKNSYINLVVVRYMGFGGEIYAVPITEQYPGWYEVWKEKQKLNP
ncbi:MAG: peptidylprolyl isomerase [Ignavibacteria bacterium]